MKITRTAENSTKKTLAYSVSCIRIREVISHKRTGCRFYCTKDHFRQVVTDLLKVRIF